METQNRQTTISPYRRPGCAGNEDAQLTNSSYYYLLYCAICKWIGKKDELTEEQRNQLNSIWKEYLGICFLNSLVFPLRTMLKQHEIYYNTGNYINNLKSYGKTYGCIASPEEAFDVLSNQETIVRDGILAMANNFLLLKQALDGSQKEQFANLCKESQQGMPDILLICGFLRDESLVHIQRSDIVRATDENGEELDNKELMVLFCRDIISKKKAILNIKGELPFLHHSSGKAGEERYPLRKAIALYKKTMMAFVNALDTYSGTDIDKVERLHIKDRGLFYKMTVPVYLSTLKKKGLDVDEFIQRWENEYGSDSAWVMEAKKECQSSNTLVEKTSSTTRNGKKQCWLREGSNETEGSMASRIEKWLKYLNTELDQFQGYAKTKTKRKEQITMVSCGMIYGVLEDVGIANIFDTGNYASSFKRTVEQTDTKHFRRQDLKYYIIMIETFKIIIKAIKDETKFSRHGSIDTRAIRYRRADEKDLIAEIRSNFSKLIGKDEFYCIFLLNNLKPLFKTYRQLLQKIKHSLKNNEDTSQYNIKEDTLSELVDSFNKTIIPYKESGNKDIREMFDENEVAEYSDNDYDNEG